MLEIYRFGATAERNGEGTDQVVLEVPYFRGSSLLGMCTLRLFHTKRVLQIFKKMKRFVYLLFSIAAC